MGTFPCNTIVRILRFINTGLPGFSISVVITNLVPFLFIQEALLGTTYFINIITYLAVRSTKLQVVQPILCTFHEFFIGDTPAHRYGRKETETFTFHKVLGTVITGIELKQITVIITISNTTHDTLITFCQFSFVTVIILHI